MKSTKYQRNMNQVEEKVEQKVLEKDHNRS